MRKSISSIIAVVLLIAFTVLASAAAFFWMNTIQSSLQEKGGTSIENSQMAECSRINLLSLRGDRAVVQNVGCDSISNVTLLINGKLTNYNLDSPIAPGESAVIRFNPQPSGEELSVKVVPNGVVAGSSSSILTECTSEDGCDDTPNTFFDDCGANTAVVDWSFKADDWRVWDAHSCGCSGNSPSNKVSNYGFEDGSTSWIFDGNASITSFRSHSGTKSVELYSADQRAVSVGQYINGFADDVSVYAFIPSTLSGDGFISVIVQYGSYNILFMLSNSYSALCNNFAGSKTFVNCSTELTDYDQWKNVHVYDVRSQFESLWPNVDFTNMTTIVGAYSSTASGSAYESYFDDFNANVTSDGYYCDSDNNGGEADGVCYEGTCVSTYIDDYDSAYDFVTFKPNVSATIRNFNSSACCKLYFDGNYYDMNVESDRAYVTLPSSFPRGDYETNITCYSSTSMKKGETFSIVVAYTHGSFANAFEDPANTAYTFASTTGDLASSAGNEIITYNHSSHTVDIYAGSSLSRVGSIHVSEAPYYVAYVAVADYDNDGSNELLIKDSNYLHIYNGNLQSEKNISSSSSGGGFVVYDIDPSRSGKEIINYYNGGLRTYSADGSGLWTYSAAYNSPNLWSGFVAPVVADISSSNSGYEILYENPSELAMLDKDGNVLYKLIFSNPNGYTLTPAVGNLSSDEGLEIAYAANYSADNMSLVVLNSSFSQLWNYTWKARGSNSFSVTSPDDLTPMEIIIGDVNGDGENNLILALTNHSRWNTASYADKILIFYSNGSLINSVPITTHKGSYPLLAELDPGNAGLEIVFSQKDKMDIMNYKGETLAEDSSLSWNNGPIVLASDVDGDGYLELIDFDSGANKTYVYDTAGNASSEWPSFHRFMNNTGLGE